MGISIVAVTAALFVQVEKTPSFGFARFSGLARIEIAKSKNMLDLRKDFTIEIWVRFQKTIKDQYFAGNYASPGMSPKVKVAYNCGWVLRKRRERNFRGRPSKTGKDRLEFAFGTLQNGWSKLEYKYKPSGAAVHIAVCRRGDRLTMYVNGAAVARASVRGLTVVMSPTPIYVGPRPFMPSDRQFRGDVQAFRISSRSRYGAARFKPDINLKADKTTLVLYDFSQQTDRTQAIDLSTNKRHGKLQQVTLHLASGSSTAKTKAKTKATAKAKPGDIKTGILPQGATLKKGESLYSKNGLYRLLVDDSGNLTLRRTSDNKLLWNAPTRRTKGRGHDLHHQGDGNVIVRDANKKPLWATGTTGHKGAFLELRHNGNLVVYSKNRRALWQSRSRQSGKASSRPKQ